MGAWAKVPKCRKMMTKIVSKITDSGNASLNVPGCVGEWVGVRVFLSLPWQATLPIRKVYMTCPSDRKPRACVLAQVMMNAEKTRLHVMTLHEKDWGSNYKTNATAKPLS